MNYSELVDAYIKKSGLSLAEIAKRMEVEKGIKIDRSYISKLKNDPKYPATEEINRALAEITSGDPEALILAAYYEKAPEEVKRALDEQNAYRLLLDYLVRKKPLKVEYNGPKEFANEEELNEVQDFINSETYLGSLPIEERDLKLTQVFKDMSENEPTTFDKLNNLLGRYNELIDQVKNVSGSNAPYNTETMLRIPVLGSIRAGEPIDRIEFNEGYTLVDPDFLRNREGFALKVKGDSMSGDRILEGDIVIVVKQEEVQPHDIAVVAINGDEATLKRVKLHGDMIMLVPSNPAYEPQLIPAKDIKIIGKVVEVKFWPK